MCSGFSVDFVSSYFILGYFLFGHVDIVEEGIFHICDQPRTDINVVANVCTLDVQIKF